MDKLARSLLAVVAMAFFISMPASAADGAKEHRVAIQVDQNDPDVMNLALNNANNVLEYYRERGENAAVEIVAYGPGLHMLRADTSPVKDRLKEMIELFSSRIKFSACNNTKQAMEKREGHAITMSRTRQSFRPASCS